MLYTSQAKGKVSVNFSDSALKDLESRRLWLKKLGEFFEKLPSPVHIYFDGYKIADVANFEYDENDFLALEFVAEKEDGDDEFIDILNTLVQENKEGFRDLLEENESADLPDSIVSLIFEYWDYSLPGNFIVLVKTSISAHICWYTTKVRVSCTPKNYLAYEIGTKEQAVALFDLHNKVSDLKEIDEIFKLGEEEYALWLEYAFWLDGHK